MNDIFNIYKNNGVDLKSTSICFDKNSYIVEMNHKIIGYFNVYYFSDNLSFDYELLEKYRHIGLGSKFFNIIENWIMQNFTFQKILLLIRYDNEISKNIVCKNNYSLDYDESEKMNMDGEMTMYSPFVKIKAKKMV